MLSARFRQPEQFLPRVQALVWDFASAAPSTLDWSPPGWFVAASRLGDGLSRSYTRIAPARDGAPYFSTFAISSQPRVRLARAPRVLLPEPVCGRRPPHQSASRFGCCGPLSILNLEVRG